jgi:hypothetical protein
VSFDMALSFPESSDYVQLRRPLRHKQPMKVNYKNAGLTWVLSALEFLAEIEY